MIGVILMLVAVILGAIFIPIGFLYSLLLVRNFNDYFFLIALSIDQLGNVICGPLMNCIFIKTTSYYQFGNPDDTISYVLGRNKQIDNLTNTAKVLDAILDFIDPGHTDMAVVRAQRVREIRLKRKFH